MDGGTVNSCEDSKLIRETYTWRSDWGETYAGKQMCKDLYSIYTLTLWQPDLNLPSAQPEQLIAICAVVKSKCAVEKGNVCVKKYRNSGQTDHLSPDYQVLCSCKSCLKYALWPTPLI